MSTILPSANHDAVIAGGLITSPAWASWLAQFNTVLTTVTLLLGLALGTTRLWQAYRERTQRE
ncbi:MAG: hypothetical protein L3J67_08270 [Hyphomicrobiaceae bacterium]|nr:hypothetical protein [Hyphomicrobiaceae bacterium]